jgi:hypothetical protein
MRKLKPLFLALLGLMTLGSIAVASASAFGSPEISLLPMEALPVKLTGSADSPNNNKITSSLETSVGSLNGEGLLFEIEATTATGGTYSADFLKVKMGTVACKSPGDAAETVLINKETVTFAHDISTTEGAGAVYTVKSSVTPLEIECGVLKVKVFGKVLGLITPTNMEKTTGFKGILECTSPGLPKETKYWDASNTEELPALFVNLGTGYRPACELVNGGIELTGSKMLEIKNA